MKLNEKDSPSYYRKLCSHCGKYLGKTKKITEVKTDSKTKKTNHKSCPSCYVLGKSNLKGSLILFAMPTNSKSLRSRDLGMVQNEMEKTSRKTELFKKYKKLEKNPSKSHKCSICKQTFKYKYSLSDHFLQEHSTDSGKQTCPICSRKYDTHLQLSTHIEWCHNPSSIGKLTDPTIMPQIRITRLTENEINSFTKRNQKQSSEIALPNLDVEEDKKPIPRRNSDKPKPNLPTKPKTRRIPRLTQETLENLPKPVIKLIKVNPETLPSKLYQIKECKVVLKMLDTDVLKNNTRKNLEKSSPTEIVKPKPKFTRRESWTCDMDLHKDLRGFDELGIEHDDHSLVLNTTEKLCPPEVLNLDTNNFKIKWMSGLLSNITRPRSDFKKTMTDILDKICPEVKPRNILYE
ncbi:NACC1 family protein [Megaselia abdita]